MSASCVLLACGSASLDDGASGAGGSDGAPPASGGASSGGQGTATGGADASGGSSGGSPSGGGPAGGSGGAEAAAGGAPGGGAGGAEPSGGADGSGGAPAEGCPFSGHVEYHLNAPESWPADMVPLITEAMDGATEYYNCYADLTKSITVNYKPGVPTAEANVDGQLSFGENKEYIQLPTTMHEIGHTMGVGYSPWSELLQDGRWTGPAVRAVIENLPPEQRDPDEVSQRDYITADTQHFWPYGLNYASEYVSEWSLIDHVRIVAAMQEDKQAYLNGDL